MPLPPTAAARRARVAVDVLFFLNALAYANVVPRLPALRDELGLSNTALGAAIAAVPVGALVAGLAVGPLVARFTSARVAVLSGLGLAATVPTLAWAPSWATLAAGFAVLGIADCAMDVAMNTHGLRVQRGYGRSILTSFHALWSIGAVAGGLAGAAAAGLEVPLGLHLAVVGTVVAVAVLGLRPALLAGPDDPMAVAGPVTAEPPDVRTAESAAGPPPRGVSARSALVLLGAVVVLAGVIEDSPSSWGAALLRDELDTSAAAAGAGFVAFQGAMTAGRLVGDRAIDRHGAQVVVRVGTLAGALAVAVALAVGHPVAVVVGFAVAGLGMASLFPVVYGAAAAIPGVSTGHAVGLMSWVGRVGFLVAPPLVGVISDHTNLRLALVVMPVAGLAAAALAGVLPAPSGQPARRGSSGSSASHR